MKKKISLIIVTFFFFLSIIVSPILFTILPKAEFSENENRFLAKFPDFSFDELKDGDFTSDIETYMTDHFPFRDYFIGLKTMVEISLGRKEINNVYICDNGYYMDAYDKPKNTQNMIDAVNELDSAVNKADIQLMLVSTAVTVYKEYIPKTVSYANQLDTMNEVYSSVDVKCIDVSEALFNNRHKYQLFYKLDHHWTTYGAFTAYEKFCQDSSFKPVDKSEFDIENVTNNFKGTTYSKVNNYTVNSEAITVFNQPELNIDVYYPDKKEHYDSLYEYSYLEKKDMYSLFLNNLQSVVEIENKDFKGKEELVVVKDSYANCFIPFLVNHYKKIYVIDPRNYNEVISDFINSKKNVSDVLVLYNIGTLDTDVGVANIY